MGTTCPKCKNGTLVFYDGGFENNPAYICNWCGYKTANPDIKLRKRRKK